MENDRTISPKTRIIVIAILLICLFVALNLSGVSKGLKNALYTISSPVQKVFLGVGDRVSDFFEVIFQAEEIKKENELLRRENQKLLKEITSLESLKKENETLRQALNIGLEKDFVLILTKFIGKGINQDLILVDKGSEDGISKGMVAVTQEKVLCGKVKEVYKNFSTISLISNKEMSFDAKIFASHLSQQTLGEGGGAETEIDGVIKGKGNFGVSFELIPHEQEVREGDVVITSASGGIFPEGLLVGKIEKVKRSDVEPFQSADVSPFCDIKEIDYLFIIK